MYVYMCVYIYNIYMYTHKHIVCVLTHWLNIDISAVIAKIMVTLYAAHNALLPCVYMCTLRWMLK